MRLISAPSVTDVTIRSAIYFIPCIRGTATHYSHGLGISLYAHHLETKLEGIRCLNPDRSFDFFVFLILVYVEVRGENAGSTNETHFGIDRHVGDANMPFIHDVNTSKKRVRWPWGFHRHLRIRRCSAFGGGTLDTCRSQPTHQSSQTPGKYFPVLKTL